MRRGCGDGILRGTKFVCVCALYAKQNNLFHNGAGVGGRMDGANPSQMAVSKTSLTLSCNERERYRRLQIIDN